MFALTFPRAFLSMPSVVVNQAGAFTWLTLPVNAAVCFVLYFAVIHVMRHIEGDLVAVSQCLLGRTLGTLAMLLLALLFLSNTTLLLRQFSEYTLLTALKHVELNIVITVYGMVAALIAYGGIEGIGRITYLILPFGIAGMLAVILGLIPFFNIYHLAPWQANGLETFVKSAATRIGTNAGILAVPVFAPAFQDLRTMKAAALFGFGGGVIIRTLSLLAFILAFDVPVAKEKVLPFYEMTRLVYLSRYVQHIEALFILLWVTAGILGIAANLYCGLYLTTRIANLPTMRPILPIVTVTLASISTLPPDIVTVVLLDSFFSTRLYTILLYGLPLSLLLALQFHKRRQKKVKPCVSE